MAGLVPPPRAYLMTYHGVPPPASALRAAIVPAPPERAGGGQGSARSCGHHWAELLQRGFALEVLRCPSCGVRRRIHPGLFGGE